MAGATAAACRWLLAISPPATEDLLVKSPQLIAATLVLAFVGNHFPRASAQSVEGYPSQKHPLRVAWEDAWTDDDYEHARRPESLHELHRNEPLAAGGNDVGHDDRPPQKKSLEALRRYEERELQRKLDRAAHLRRINQQTGNSQLIDIADRMEQRALEHYKRQLDRIQEQEDPSRQLATPAAEEGVPADAPLESILKVKRISANSPRPTLTSPAQPTLAPVPQPTGANAAHVSDQLQRRLVNEQRILQQRLDAAERLRQLNNGPQGNKQLLATADRMEQRAWEQFEQRVQQLVDPQGTRPPRPQYRHHRQHYVTDDAHRSLDERERDMEEVDWVVPEKPVRRVIKGLRHALGR